jgi:hypothetical protein
MPHATRSRWTLLAATVLVAVSLSAGSPAGANPPRVTRGDVQALLEAFENGGWAILLHSPTAQGAPADVNLRGEIRPLASHDRRHYCVDDWHVILLGIVVGGDASFTRQDAEALLNQTTVSFTLDGAPLPTTRTAIKPFLAAEQFELEKAYAFQEGRIMAPTDLSVGSHQLVATISDPSGGPPDVLEITFFIDASGTGVCL